MQVKIAKKPFAEGETRLAYHCEIQFQKGWKTWVVKSFKGTGDKGAHSVDQYLKQIEVSTIAAHLGNLFNTTAAKPPGCPKVSFLKSHVISTNSIPARNYCLEHLLEGTFTKLCKNTGYWNEAALDEQNDRSIVSTQGT